jgi:endonuclease YncB( thermonuclease family)
MLEAFIGFVFAWSVIDGDTVRVNVHTWPNHAAVDERVRLVRIDAPEMHATKQCERDMALAATDFAKKRMTEGKSISVQVSFKQTRDGFGRILGDVIIDGRSLSDDMLAYRVARPYSDRVNKLAWC